MLVTINVNYVTGATNIKIDKKSRERFRQDNGVTHRRRTIEAVLDNVGDLVPELLRARRGGGGSGGRTRGAAPRILEPNRVTAARRGRGRQLGARHRGRDEHQEPEIVNDFHGNSKYRCLVCLKSYSMANNGRTYWM